MMLRSRSTLSLPGVFAAVQRLYRDLGLGELPRGKLFKATKKAAEKWLAASDATKQKHAITINELLAIKSHLNLQLYYELAFTTALFVAFWALLRGSEFTNGALQWEDVAIHDWGMATTVRHSKNHDDPQTVFVARRADSACCTALVERLAAATPKELQVGPMFRVKPGGKAISYQRFNADLKSLAQELFEGESRNMASHSPRRGGYTAMLNAGVSEPHLQLHGRWRGLSFRKYLDKLSLVARLIPSELHARLTGVNTEATAAAMHKEAAAIAILQSGVPDAQPGRRFRE